MLSLYHYSGMFAIAETFSGAAAEISYWERRAVMLKTYIDTGKIVNTHGLRGDVKLEAWTDDPEMLCQVKTLYLDAQGAQPLNIQKARMQKGMVLLKFEGIDTVDQATTLRNKIVYIHRDDIPMEEGEYLIQDLVGCRVIDADDGHEYGELKDVTFNGASDIYHIQFPNGSIQLCPAIDEVLVSTDVEAREIRIRPLAGLFEEE